MERRRKREWSTSEGKGEVDRERERSGMGGSCGSELMEEGSELLEVDWSLRCWGAGVRSRWCLDEQSTHRHMEGMRTAIWPAWSWVRRRSLSLSVFAHLWVLSLPLSLFARLRKWFEVKITTKNILRPVALFYSQHWKHFLFDLIFNNNQTSTFTEKHFRKWFETKTNAP